MSPVSDGVGELRRPTAAVAPGERGATRIADRVVSKIAAEAARETLGDQSEDASHPHATVVVRPQSRLRSSGGTPIAAAHVRVVGLDEHGTLHDYLPDTVASPAAHSSAVGRSVELAREHAPGRVKVVALFSDAPIGDGAVKDARIVVLRAVLSVRAVLSF